MSEGDNDKWRAQVHWTALDSPNPPLTFGRLAQRISVGFGPFCSLFSLISSSLKECVHVWMNVEHLSTNVDETK